MLLCISHAITFYSSLSSRDIAYYVLGAVYIAMYPERWGMKVDGLTSANTGVCIYLSTLASTSKVLVILLLTVEFTSREIAANWSFS